MVGEVVALSNPVGVLHAETLVAPRPVLSLEVAFLVIHLEHLVSFKAVGRRHQVDGHHGVHILTLSHHVVFLEVHVACADIQTKFVFDQSSGVADGEVVAVESVVHHDTFGVGGSQREECLVGCVAGGQSDGVGLVETGLEEIGGVIRARLTEFCAPAAELAVVRTVGVLKLGSSHCVEEDGGVGVSHFSATLFTLAGGDHHNAVGSFATVECRSGSTGEHRD